MKNRLQMEVAMKAAIGAGEILTHYYEERVKVSSKESSRDIVSEVDRLAEDKVIKTINEFDKKTPILTEEQGSVRGKAEDTYWLIDALDGTVNYVNHVPFFCVSIAYIKAGRPEAAAIYAPLFEDLYYADRSLGVFKNEAAIKVKDAPFNESLFSVAFSGKSHDPKTRPEEFSLFAKVNDTSRGCLRTGSAALNLAYLAEGRLNGCWGKANKYWDVAAGLLIAEMAGATVKQKFVESNKQKCSYIATSPSIASELRQLTKSVLSI